ncbi:hypothetical protein [Streptosporangium sp. NPDC004631]
MGHLTLMTPALFFVLAFLAVAGTCSPARVDVAVSPVSCPAGRATVALSAGEDLGHEAGFTVHRDGRVVHEGRIGPKGRRVVAVRVAPGDSARIAVRVEGQDTADHTVRSWCEGTGSSHASAGRRPPRGGPHPSHPSSRKPSSPNPSAGRAGRPPGPSPDEGGGLLPVTGQPGLVSTIAGAGAVVLAGGLLWWYGTVWPRRAPEDPIDPDRSPYGPRRYPGLKL